MLRTDILAKIPSKKRVKHNDPDLGQVWLRGLTGQERRVFFAEYAAGGEKADMGAEYMVACGLIDEQGANLFTPDDLEVVSDLGLATLGRIGIEVAKISGLTEESKKTTAKNSEATKKNGSG